MSREPIPNFLRIEDLAGLLDTTPDVLELLIRCQIHPPWRWTRQMKRPRFGWKTVPEWLRILESVDLDTLPSDPPPLQRPEEVFEDRGPTPQDLMIAAGICGVPWEKAAEL